MMDVLEKGIRKKHAGFRSDRSCVDQINMLRIIIEQPAEMYMFFVDFQVAYDSLKRECIWRSLRNRGLPRKFANIIKELYNGFECCVLHNEQLTDSFTTVSGVRQGCLL
jgi:hypothetical protein